MEYFQQHFFPKQWRLKRKLANIEFKCGMPINSILLRFLSLSLSLSLPLPFPFSLSLSLFTPIIPYYHISTAKRIWGKGDWPKQQPMSLARCSENIKSQNTIDTFYYLILIYMDMHYAYVLHIRVCVWKAKIHERREYFIFWSCYTRSQWQIDIITQAKARWS